MLKIYGIPTLNTIKPVLTAEWLELEYDFVAMDFGEGEHKTPEHLARHPLGKVPVIEHDDHTLFESNVICTYLAETWGSKLYPAETRARSLVQQWIDMVSYHPGRWLAERYLQRFIKPKFLGADPDESELEQANTFLDRQLPVVERHLADQAYFCGEDITVADLVAFCYFHTTEFSGYSLADYPAITAWYGRIRGSDAFARTAERLSLPA